MLEEEEDKFRKHKRRIDINFRHGFGNFLAPSVGIDTAPILRNERNNH